MGIEETSEGFKVIGLDGDELDNSPYETERKATQAFNAHKMGYSGDEEDESSTDNSDDNDDENSIDLNQDGENDNKDESNSSFMSMLGNKYVLAGLGLGAAYLILKDSDSEADNVEAEESVTDSDSTDDSEQNNLDSGRMSAMEVLS